ncbi:hypothetical protein PMAYCL1PPCAC_21917, partial [Pristionchus mayeri]
YGQKYHETLENDCACEQGAICECSLGCFCNEELCHNPRALSAVKRGAKSNKSIKEFAKKILLAREAANRRRMLEMKKEAIEGLVHPSLLPPMENEKEEDTKQLPPLIQQYRLICQELKKKGWKDTDDASNVPISTGVDGMKKGAERKKRLECLAVSSESEGRECTRDENEKRTFDIVTRKEMRMEFNEFVRCISPPNEKKKNRKYEDAPTGEQPKKEKHKESSQPESVSPLSCNENRKIKRHEDGPAGDQPKTKKGKQLDSVLDRPQKQQQIASFSFAEKKKQRIENKDSRSSASFSSVVDRMKNGQKQKKKTGEAKKGGAEKRSLKEKGESDKKEMRGRVERRESECGNGIDCNNDIVVIDEE